MTVVESFASDLSSTICRAGVSLLDCLPVFSPDSKYLLYVRGHVIKVVNVATGACIHDLNGHSKLVTSLVFSCQNPLQVYSSSLDNTIIKWDYLDAFLIQRSVFKVSTYLLFALPQFGTTSEHVIHGVQESTTSEGQLVSYHFDKGKKASVRCEPILENVPGYHHQIDIGCDQVNPIVAYINHRDLTVYSLKSKATLTHTEKAIDLTCVACHPRSPIVAAGNYKGHLVIWHNVTSDKPVRTSLHWHALPLKALKFTTAGTNIYSGGYECVLAKWRYETTSKDTLPRLGSPIRAIVCSKDNNFIATCHDSNDIKVISSQFKVKQNILSLTRSLRKSPQTILPVGLQYDPRTKCLVTNGLPGHVQFYDLFADKHLYNLDVVCQNYISPENSRKPLIYIDVDLIAFNSDGTWMASVEYRNDKKTSIELRMKMWKLNAEQQTFELNTQIELPHTDKVTGLYFRPSYRDKSPMVVTTSADKKFKQWKIIDDTDLYRASECWSCDYVGQYKNLEPTSAAFSVDGTLLGVAFDKTLTLWDPERNTIQETLPQSSSTIKKFVFGVGKFSHFLCSVTKSAIFVWNLISFEVLWHRTLSVSHLSINPFSSCLAAVTNRGELLVYEMDSAVPIYQKTLDGERILSTIFIPWTDLDSKKNPLTWQREARYYMITDKQELLTVDVPALLDDSKDQGSNPSIMKQDLPQTLFSEMLMKQKQSRLQQNNAPLNRFTKSEIIDEILSTPAHVLPPMSSLARSFFDSILPKKKGIVQESTSDSDSSTSDDDSSDDESTNSDEESPDMDVDHQEEEATDDKTDAAAENVHRTDTAENVHRTDAAENVHRTDAAENGHRTDAAENGVEHTENLDEETNATTHVEDMDTFSNLDVDGIIERLGL